MALSAGSLKVVITDHGFPNVDQEQDLISQAGARLMVAQSRLPEELVDSCHDADALLVQWARIDRELIERLERCRVIVRYGIGVDSVDLEAASKRGIPVCNIPDYCIDEVADHSLALALSLARQLSETEAELRRGIWKITPPASFPSFRHLTFATAGFGRIARAVLHRARAFGFQLAAYDPFVDAQIFEKEGVRKLDCQELFEQAGVLSLHLPLTPETQHFVGKSSLSLMRKHAIIVNTARGGLIDTIALAAALTSGQIQAAGLDVFENEPLPAGHPLLLAPRVALTSHTAWYSAGSIPLLQRKAAQEIVRGLRKEPLLHVVNKATLKDPLI